MRWSEIDSSAPVGAAARAREEQPAARSPAQRRSRIAILAPSPRIEGDFALTTNGASPASGYSKGKRRVDALLPPDMPPWRLHDIRRTVAIRHGAARRQPAGDREDIEPHERQFCRIVAVYQRHDFADEKRAALDRWGDFVAGLVSGQPSDRCPFRGAR